MSIVKPAREHVDAVAGDALRTLIMDCAAEVIAQSGLANLSLDEIARRLSISKSTFYRVFESKQGLLVALAVGDYDRVTQIASGFLAGDAINAATLRAFINDACDVAWRRPGVALMHAFLPVLPEVAQDPKFQRARENLLRSTTQLIERARKNRTAPLPPQEMAKFMLSAIVNAVPDPAAFGGSREAARDALARTLTAAILTTTRSL